MSLDNRQVVLLKSKLTLNRFYALASLEREWKNAEEIEDFPDDVILGIAYPCLEDGLNDFAVIRSTFETLDCFPDDQELRDEFMVMVIEARDTLCRRLSELRDRLARRQAHFLGTDLNEFKAYAIKLARQGNIRRTLDNMMKLDVYESVAELEAQEAGGAPDMMYLYEFRPENALETIQGLPPLAFVVRLFDDVLSAVLDDSSYATKYTFDKLVFQKFIALMYVNYATTDPIFYGTNKADYGVSADKDMTDTPLYKAVSEALRAIEKHLREAPEDPEETILMDTRRSSLPSGATPTVKAPPPPGADLLGDLIPTDDTGLVFGDPEESFGDPEEAFEAPPYDLSGDAPTDETQAPVASPAGMERAMTASEAKMPTNTDGRSIALPSASTTEQRIMVPLNSITMAAELLKNSGVPMAATYAQMILTSAEALQAALKEWGVLEER